VDSGSLVLTVLAEKLSVSLRCLGILNVVVLFVVGVRRATAVSSGAFLFSLGILSIGGLLREGTW